MHSSRRRLTTSQSRTCPSFAIRTSRASPPSRSVRSSTSLEPRRSGLTSSSSRLPNPRLQEYDVLPDPATWATGYSLFKFTEPPSSEGLIGAGGAEAVSTPALPCSISACSSEDKSAKTQMTDPSLSSPSILTYSLPTLHSPQPSSDLSSTRMASSRSFTTFPNQQKQTRLLCEGCGSITPRRRRSVVFASSPANLSLTSHFHLPSCPASASLSPSATSSRATTSSPERVPHSRRGRSWLSSSARSRPRRTRSLGARSGRREPTSTSSSQRRQLRGRELRSVPTCAYSFFTALVQG